MHITIDGTTWLFDGRATNAGSPAAGLLINVRMVNSVFEDDRPQLPNGLAEFQPDANTDRFIACIPAYAAHGINAFTIGLQGGTPGYEGAVNSAFNADGTLRHAYLKRLERVILAANKNGCAIILSCLYQRQYGHSRQLRDSAAIHAAIANTAHWIIAQKFSNVALEIANEYAHAGFANWPAGAWLRSPQAQVELISTAKAIAPDLPVSTSGMGNGTISGLIASVADFTILHFNNTPTSAIPACIEACKPYGKPIVCNEDAKVGPIGAVAAHLAITAGAGWGFMHCTKNQYAPFEFAGADDDPPVYTTLAHLTQVNATLDTPNISSGFVLITNPNDGDHFTTDASITIHASLLDDPLIGIANMQFFANNHLIGTAASTPWHIQWNNIPSGRYNLTAVGLDINGTAYIHSHPVDIVITKH